MLLLSVCVNIGMWFERFVIVSTSLHRGHLSPSWKMYYPTWVDYLQLLGGFGVFATLYLIFIRFLPMVAISEVKACLPEARPDYMTDSPQPEDSPAGSRTQQEVEPPSGQNYGLLARFASSCELLESVRGLYAAGYRCIDTYSPFPIHGMERALRLSPSRVPAFVLGGGIFGLLSGYLLQYYMNAISYPLLVGGKPFHSAEAFVPISYESMILFAAIGAVVGMLVQNGLPQFYDPVFFGRSFPRATDDGFFLSVESKDAMFDKAVTPGLLSELGAVEVEYLRDSDEQDGSTLSWSIDMPENQVAPFHRFS
jgi:hypothetical protein